MVPEPHTRPITRPRLVASWKSWFLRGFSGRMKELTPLKASSACFHISCDSMFQPLSRSVELPLRSSFVTQPRNHSVTVCEYDFLHFLKPGAVAAWLTRLEGPGHDNRRARTPALMHPRFIPADISGRRPSRMIASKGPTKPMAFPVRTPASVLLCEDPA